MALQKNRIFFAVCVHVIRYLAEEYQLYVFKALDLTEQVNIKWCRIRPSLVLYAFKVCSRTSIQINIPIWGSLVYI